MTWTNRSLRREGKDEGPGMIESLESEHFIQVKQAVSTTLYSWKPPPGPVLWTLHSGEDQQC